MAPEHRSPIRARRVVCLALGMITAAAGPGCGSRRASVGSSASTPSVLGPDSREAKLLLAGERFAQREQAFVAYWALVRKVAAEQGVKVRPRYKGAREKRREVTFWDTADHSLRRRGYALRTRRKVRGGTPASELEYALKLRSPDLAVAAQADVGAPGLRVDEELEEDLTSAPDAPGGIRRLYARRVKLKMERSVPSTVGGFAELFPVLATLGLPLETALAPVGGAIDERRVSPGKLDFGQRLVATLDLTVWLDSAGRPLIAEVSYDHPIREPAAQPQPATERVRTFLGALRAASQGWVATEGMTKTAFTYGRVASQPAEGSP